MKGVILAGGTGSRLLPLTKVTNKHLLPIYNKPMIFFPLETLKKAGIVDIIIVTGGEYVGDFMKLLGSGREYGVNLTYRVQDGSGGIPVALNLAKDFVGDDKCLTILGDNIILESLEKDVERFEKSDKGCYLFLKKVHDPDRFGVAILKDGVVVDSIEKPKEPVSDLAITGLYMFDNKAFKYISSLKPSARGELEITEVIKHYIDNKDISHRSLDSFWIDAGTFPSLFIANRHIGELEEWEKHVRRR